VSPVELDEWVRRSLDYLSGTCEPPWEDATVSTNYYLHCTDFPESVHIGKAAGALWTTDASRYRYSNGAEGWAGTAGLVAYLKALGRPWGTLRDYSKPWVADEYGCVISVRTAAKMIGRMGTQSAVDYEFS